MDSDWLNVFYHKKNTKYVYMYLYCYHSYRPCCEWTKDISMIEEFYFLVMTDPISLRFFELFEKYGGYKSGKLKLKKPKQLQVGLFWSTHLIYFYDKWKPFYTMFVSEQACLQPYDLFSLRPEICTIEDWAGFFKERCSVVMSGMLQPWDHWGVMHMCICCWVLCENIPCGQFI